MLPYFNIPFEYYGRNSMGMTPTMPMDVGGMMPSQMSSPYMQTAVPVPGTGMQPMMPQMQPMQQPMMCPLMQMNQQQYMPVMPETDDTEELDERPLASDPPPVLSNNPAVPSITLFKELTAYPNYGNPSGNADILYTGNRGVWTFDLPQYLSALGNLRAQIVIRAVLDDHANVPVDRYSANITVNGTRVHTGRLTLEHGVPAGGRFTNWRSLTFNVPQLRRNNRVVIVNTSTAGPNDWIALDWMEMRFTSR